MMSSGNILLCFLLSVIIVSQPVFRMTEVATSTEEQELKSLQSGEPSEQSNVEIERQDEAQVQIQHQSGPSIQENPFSRPRDMNSKNKKPFQVNHNWESQAQGQNGNYQRTPLGQDQLDGGFQRAKEQKFPRKNHHPQNYNGKNFSLKSLLKSDIIIFMAIGVVSLFVVRACIKKRKKCKKAAMRKMFQHRRPQMASHLSQRIQNVTFDDSIEHFASVEDRIRYHQSEIIKLKGRQNIPVGRPFFINQANIEFAQR